MEPLPPPPPPRPDTSWQSDHQAPPSPRARPQLVTAAAVILIVLGVLQALAGVVLLFPPDDLGRITSMGDLNLEGVVRGAALFVLVVALLEILAAILVLRLSDGGRILAIVLSSIGILGGIGSVSGGNGLGVVTLGLYGFVIFVLFSQAPAFRGTRRG